MAASYRWGLGKIGLNTFSGTDNCHSEQCGGAIIGFHSGGYTSVLEQGGIDYGSDLSAIEISQPVINCYWENDIRFQGAARKIRNKLLDNCGREKELSKADGWSQGEGDGFSKTLQQLRKPS